MRARPAVDPPSDRHGARPCQHEQRRALLLPDRRHRLGGGGDRRARRHRQGPQGALRLRPVPPGDGRANPRGRRRRQSPWRFQGQLLDRETGLYKMGHRYYAPTIGDSVDGTSQAAVDRWTQVDPLNQFQDPRQANRYVYAGGDPVNLVDPSGTGIVDFGKGLIKKAPVICVVYQRAKYTHEHPTQAYEPYPTIPPSEALKVANCFNPFGFFGD